VISLNGQATWGGFTPSAEKVPDIVIAHDLTAASPGLYRPLDPEQQSDGLGHPWAHENRVLVLGDGCALRNDK
jgi:hypothetical protein